MGSLWRSIFGKGNKEEDTAGDTGSVEDDQNPVTPSANDMNNNTSEEHVYYECGERLQKTEDENIPPVKEYELEHVGSNVPECTPLKLIYEECFNAWFANKFLYGDASSMSPCEVLLTEYTDCVKKGLEEEDLILIQNGCRYTTDPNDGCVNEPRDRAPPGAKYHHPPKHH